VKRKKILVLCPSPEGTNPGQRLKYEQYFQSWRDAGYDVTVASFQTQRFWDIIYKTGFVVEKILWTVVGYLRRVRDLFRIPFYDGLYIYMAVTPFGPPFFEWLVHKLNPRIIFDIEDMAFMTHTSAANKWIAKLKGSRKYIFLMKHARFVITSTPSLSEYVAQYNKKVNDITATFNTDRFTNVPEYVKRDVTIIGWTGSHSTIPYLHILDDVFRKVAALRSIKIRVISNAHYECKGVNVENVKWTEEKEVWDLHQMDIGVYPVPKEEWVLGKSGCKAITYMSVGLPAVSTAYGNVVKKVVDNGVNGFLADNEDEWVELLIKLIDDVELRRQTGMAGREKVVNEFSIIANIKKYLDAFEVAYGKTFAK
jgi:glycosyltransferase involved in cell wall biosynthesis